MTYSLERIMRVYNDDTGDYVEVREDADGLGLVEIRQSENGARVVMTVDQALMLRDAVTGVCEHIVAKGKP